MRFHSIYGSLEAENAFVWVNSYGVVYVAGTWFENEKRTTYAAIPVTADDFVVTFV